MRIALTKNTSTPELKRILGKVERPRAIYQAGAKTVQVEISQHLKRLQARGNKKGWPAQKFFAGKATSVERNVGIASVTAKGAIITIADPRFVHRITGGTVTAKRSKMLAIPLTAEAYAASGKGSIKESMPGLKVVKLPRCVYLVREQATKVKGSKIKTLRIIPLFKLVRSVTHNPHPEEMPDEKVLSTKARDAMFTAAKLIFKAE